MNERWDEQNSLLVESHERLVQELTDEYEYKLQEEQLALQRVRDEKDDLLHELEETRRQVEEDADQEIEELKDKYEVKLSAEREQHLRLKGENGIMRKKHHVQLKEIEDGKDDNKQLVARQKELYHQISMLEKEIAGLKKEIRERDETIGDKEKRIYDLKKKNRRFSSTHYARCHRSVKRSDRAITLISSIEAHFGCLTEEVLFPLHVILMISKEIGKRDEPIEEVELRIHSLFSPR